MVAELEMIGKAWIGRINTLGSCQFFDRISRPFVKINGRLRTRRRLNLLVILGDRGIVLLRLLIFLR